ncbi:MAG: hypothetical protein ACYS99_03810 [Planctomycetota bacterium]|jgi:hypothetical protein
MKHPAVLLICGAVLLVGARAETLEAAPDATTIKVVATQSVGAGMFFTLPMVGGTFEATGDVDDEGDVSGSLWIASWGWGAPPKSYWFLGLEGDHGTLIVSLHVQSGTWTVVSGTDDYSGVTGGGSFTTKTSGTWPLTYTWTLTGSVD